MLILGLVCFVLWLSVAVYWHNSIGEEPSNLGFGILFDLFGQGVNLLFWLLMFFAIAFFIK